jgi:hypothetical protein
MIAANAASAREMLPYLWAPVAGITNAQDEGQVVHRSPVLQEQHKRPLHRLRSRRSISRCCCSELVEPFVLPALLLAPLVLPLLALDRRPVLLT